MNAKCERINKHNYNCIDLFKLFAALLVVIIHVNEVGSFIPDCIISSFSNFAVPFFFIVSGFFYKRGLDSRVALEDKKEYFLKYTRRLIIIYLFYSIISLPSAILTYASKYAGISFVRLCMLLFRRYFICGSGVVWYLLAMVEAAVVLYFIDKYKTKTYPVLFVFIVIGLLLGLNYDCFGDVVSNNFLGIINKFFYTLFSWSNNFIMKAVPYMGIGYLFYVKKDRIHLNSTILCVFFGILSGLNISIFFIQYFSDIAIFQHIYFSYIINIPQAILFFLIAINIKTEINKNISLIFRELSSSIFYLHTYFIYYVIDPILGVESNFLFKFFIAVFASITVYIIVKKLRIKPLMYVLNIRN